MVNHGSTMLNCFIQLYFQVNGDPNWILLTRISAPDATQLRIEGLKPHSHYRLRLIAENIAGHSSPSAPTTQFQTIQTYPEQPPHEVTVRTVNQTAIRVRWKVR